jgi:hypothetical protein
VKIRDWAQAAEDLGYATIEVPDHVFGAAARDGWTPIYNEEDPFHETFVTLGFLAAATKTIRLSSGVLILPQRQTGVVAKQAAEADLLSGGRLRLGIGVGWNHVEYEALGMDWHTRGARQAEQVDVLKRLWTENLVTYQGRFCWLGRAPSVWVGLARGRLVRSGSGLAHVSPPGTPRDLPGVGVVCGAFPRACYACCACSRHAHGCWHTPCCSPLTRKRIGAYTCPLTRCAPWKPGDGHPCLSTTRPEPHGAVSGHR